MADIRRGPRGRHLPPDGGEASAGARRWVVQELVTEAILLHEAQAAGIAPTGDEAVLAPEIVSRLVDSVTVAVTVDRRAVREYYVRNADRFRRREARRVRHVLLADEATALDVFRSLEDGADLGDLAEEVVGGCREPDHAGRSG